MSVTPKLLSDNPRWAFWSPHRAFRTPGREWRAPRWALGRWLGALVLVVNVVPVQAKAQDVSARAYLTPSTVELSRQFVLNVEITGTQRTDSDPELPVIGSFARYLGAGSSTNMQVVNGITTLSMTVQYRYQSVEEGTFDIGPVRVRAGGRVLETEPLTLTISSAPPSSQGPSPSTDDPSGLAPEDLFIRAEVSKRRVYENEPVVVRYRLFTRVNVSSYSVTKTGGNEGFWVEDVPQTQNPQVEQVVRDGVQYASAVLRHSVLFPTGAGTKTVEAISVEAQVRRQRTSRDPFEDFFNRSSLFGSNVPVIVTSEPVDIEVLPLPAEGRPESFTGLVGRLNVAASLDRADVQTNEAVTLSVRVRGEGNLRGLAAPTIDFSRDFEVFPPEASSAIDRSATRISGTKTYDYVLIPRTPGDKTIPSIEVSYFDVGSGRYVVAETEPLHLSVTGDALLIAPGVRTGVETLREDIRFIHIAPPRFTVADASIFDDPGFWIVTLLPLLAMVGALGLRRHRDRLEGDVAFARGRRASRVARKRLGRAQSLASDEDVRAFYAEVERALRGFLADKLNVAEAGFMSESAQSRLVSRGVSPEGVREYLECLGVCDRARFAPPGATDEQRAGFYERAAKAMAAVQEEIP